ncbi:MAG: competence/damage-inducible protein A [Planctomycetota bacterium]|nr:MAG: competence/damage-inducible protein A [Planctomycetota bacterium]
MKACIVSIGNELLSGQTVDTNAAWLSGKLFELGIATTGSWVVPDEQPRILAAIRQASQEGDLILVTGGLGPTDDDLSRQAVAVYWGVPLEFQPELLVQISDFFEKRGKKMASNNRSQAYIPAGSAVLDNPVGTAPGFWACKDNIFLAAMPGVPAEMKRMFTDQVIPRITRLTEGPTVVSGKLRCFGAGESDIAQKLGDLMKRGRNPLINCTCGSGEILLHIIAAAEDKKTAQAMIQKDKALLRECLGGWAYGEDDQTLAAVVGRLLKTRHKTIALAESCTGGLLSQMLTDVPGASDYVRAGWVTYSNEAKTSQLGVPEAVITDFGAVSEPVARIMAQQAAQKCDADVAVAITGIAGPSGGTDEKPVGLVYIAVAIDGDCEVKEYRFPPANRHWIRLRSALTALNLVRLRLAV